jgi:hypothetical protein
MGEIVLDGVRKEFAGGGVAVDNVDMTISDGEFDPRTKARVGDTIRLAVDPSRFYFFAPETGETLLGKQTLAAAGA